MSFSATVRLLPCDLVGMGWNPGNNLLACGGKAVYIYPLQTPPVGVLGNGSLFFVWIGGCLCNVLFLSILLLYVWFFSLVLFSNEPFTIVLSLM